MTDVNNKSPNCLLFAIVFLVSLFTHASNEQTDIESKSTTCAQRWSQVGINTIDNGRSRCLVEYLPGVWIEEIYLQINNFKH